VERRQDPRDGRVVQVSITEAGRLKLRSHRAAQVALIFELVRQIEPTEREQLVVVARAIGRLLNGAVTEMAAGDVRGQLSVGT